MAMVRSVSNILSALFMYMIYKRFTKTEQIKKESDTYNSLTNDLDKTALLISQKIGDLLGLHYFKIFNTGINLPFVFADKQAILIQLSSNSDLFSRIVKTYHLYYNRYLLDDLKDALSEDQYSQIVKFFNL